MDTDGSDKLYFRIGEVAELTSLNPSLLRYWETEFVLLTPAKSRSGQRLYTKQDIDLILEIKTLLHSERLTIEGARKRIAGKKRIFSDQDEDNSKTSIIKEVKEDLRRFRDLL
ncbi:MAG: MerR family transcriptional regulator [Deltaproteobacteria bacterium]